MTTKAERLTKGTQQMTAKVQYFPSVLWNYLKGGRPQGKQ